MSRFRHGFFNNGLGRNAASSELMVPFAKCFLKSLAEGLIATRARASSYKKN